MHITKAHVDSVRKIQDGIYLIKVLCGEDNPDIYPGQFYNIKVSETYFPLLRRPFSICDADKDCIYFMFNIHGEGTRLLAHKINGDILDILGPLGNGFSTGGQFDTAVFVAGGMGSAPFPLLTKKLKGVKEIVTFVGGRSISDVITYGLENVLISTDDGSSGFKGNVVELMESNYHLFKNKIIRIFACGPNAMLKAVQDFALEKNVECQLSTESAMACGFGICQGCPIETREDGKYYLVCKDGPVFNAGDIKL